MSNRAGTLYIVATPIGNLDDISLRALNILRQVDLVAAEDTRHSKPLLVHFGITASLLPYHDFNERETHASLIAMLLDGKSIALISDAGTPLINDPGYRLVKSAHENSITVVPIPGPSALISALSVAGLPTDRFAFEGYSPGRRAARLRYFESLKFEKRTLVFYETPHRIEEFLQDASAVFGPDRYAAIAREMTKKFESISNGTLLSLVTAVQDSRIPQKGEFVVVVQGSGDEREDSVLASERILGLLMQELPLKKAAVLTSQITGTHKNELYQLGLKLRDR